MSIKSQTLPKRPTKLYAPSSYWEASAQERAKICNGCGAKKGLDVPDTFYGLSITSACNIHDWMYQHGETLADKLFADAIFRLNLTILIDEANYNFATTILKPLRHGRASTYYNAVVLWGEEAFWVKKPKNEVLVITYKGRFEEVGT